LAEQEWYIFGEHPWYIMGECRWYIIVRTMTLGDVEGKWLQFRLRGIDNFGVWLENPHFSISAASDTEAKVSQKQREALIGEALVLVKWQYVATMIYVGGQEVEHIPLGFAKK